MPKIIGINFEATRVVLEVLRKELKADEPVDSFELANKNKLEASLKAPFQRPHKTSFKEELIDKAAVLFYLLIENHVLPTNGNKRLATHALLMMFFLNSYFLVAGEKSLYKLAILVAILANNRVKQHLIIRKIKGFLRKYAKYEKREKKAEYIKEIKEDFYNFLYNS